MHGSDVTIIEQTPLWDGQGAFRPAGVAWQPWRLVGGLTRLSVAEIVSTDRDGLAVLAVRDDQANCEAGNDFLKCPRIHMIIANTNIHRGQTQVSYQVQVNNARPAGDARLVTINRAVINEGTRQFEFQSTQDVSLIDGSLFHQFQSSVPAVDYVEINLGPAE